MMPKPSNASTTCVNRLTNAKCNTVTLCRTGILLTYSPASDFEKACPMPPDITMFFAKQLDSF